MKFLRHLTLGVLALVSLPARALTEAMHTEAKGIQGCSSAVHCQTFPAMSTSP